MKKKILNIEGTDYVVVLNQTPFQPQFSQQVICLFWLSFIPGFAIGVQEMPILPKNVTGNGEEWPLQIAGAALVRHILSQSADWRQRQKKANGQRGCSQARKWLLISPFKGVANKLGNGLFRPHRQTQGISQISSPSLLALNGRLSCCFGFGAAFQGTSSSCISSSCVMLFPQNMQYNET